MNYQAAARSEGIVGWLRLHGRWAAAVDKRIVGHDLQRTRRRGHTAVVRRRPHA